MTRARLGLLSGEGARLALGDADLRFEDGEHPYVERHRVAIAENWKAEQAANPRLFDGRMLFQHALSLDGDRLSGVSRLAPFSAFLHWRRAGRPDELVHLFAMALVVAASGRLLAVRMSAHTANPGRIYCPAGSLDGNDITEGRVDIDGNMVREVAEETGLDLGLAVRRGGLVAHRTGNRLVLTRRFDMPMSEAEISARVVAHMEADHEQEIAGHLFIGRDDAIDPAYPDFMRPILGHLFA